jgi:hypothetical protein
MKSLAAGCLLVMATLGCSSKQTIVIPTATVGALKDSDVSQMGSFGAGLKNTTTPAPTKPTK